MSQNWKLKISHTLLERRTLHCSSYKNCKLKVKLWWVGAHERKKNTFFVAFILSKGNFFYICVFSQFIVYWMNYQNIGWWWRWWWDEEGGDWLRLSFERSKGRGDGATKIEQVWTRGEGGSKYRALCNNVITECLLL